MITHDKYIQNGTFKTIYMLYLWYIANLLLVDTN